MNSLVQQDSTLIGSQKDIEELEKKERAKLLVVGDSHGDFQVVVDIIISFGKSVDALIFTGDGFCDVAACIAQAGDDEKLMQALPPVILIVRGNGDPDTYSIKLTDNEEEKQIQFSIPSRVSCVIAGRGVFVAHGDHYRVDMGTDTFIAAAHAVDADMAFFGHTHRTHWEESGGTLILNPGSCSSPRSALPPSFTIVSFPGKQDRFSIEYYAVEKTLFKNYKFVPLAVHMN